MKKSPSSFARGQRSDLAPSASGAPKRVGYPNVDSNNFATANIPGAGNSAALAANVPLDQQRIQAMNIDSGAPTFY